MKVEYSANNSGGRWWLSDDDWLNLERAGWKVEWVPAVDKIMTSELANTPHPTIRGKFTWLGAIARNASLECETPTDAMKSFEKVTGQDVMDEGCNCCGAPHSFNWNDGSGRYQYASGASCAEHLFGESAPSNLREALEKLKEREP